MPATSAMAVQAAFPLCRSYWLIENCLIKTGGDMVSEEALRHSDSGVHVLKVYGQGTLCVGAGTQTMYPPKSIGDFFGCSHELGDWLVFWRWFLVGVLSRRARF